MWNKELIKENRVLDWDEAIFNFNLEKAIVHKDKSITFKFYSGFETKKKAEELTSDSLVFLYIRI